MSRDPYGVRDELRRRIVVALRPVVLQPEDLARLMQLFYAVDEDWERIDVTTMGESGETFLDQRWITAKIPVQSVRYERPIDRTVEAAG